MRNIGVRTRKVGVVVELALVGGVGVGIVSNGDFPPLETSL